MPPDSPISKEDMRYQLVLRFSLSEDFDFDALIALETRLGFELDGEHIVAGHELGSDEVIISVFTDDPESAFEGILVILSPRLTAVLKAAYRLVDSSEYRWVYPANSEEEFRIG